MNIPNIITLFRILLIPIYLYFFYSGLDNAIYYAGIVFLIAGISDVLDGYIARKYDLTSDLGAVLDPIADKLMMFAILISFTHKGIIPIWILYAMGIKEIAQILGGAILYIFKGKQVVPSNIFGKLATVVFYIATFSVILKVPINISKVLFLLTVVFNIVAFINYLFIYLKKRRKNDLTNK